MPIHGRLVGGPDECGEGRLEQGQHPGGQVEHYRVGVLEGLDHEGHLEHELCQELFVVADYGDWYFQQQEQQHIYDQLDREPVDVCCRVDQCEVVNVVVVRQGQDESIAHEVVNLLGGRLVNQLRESIEGLGQSLDIVLPVTMRYTLQDGPEVVGEGVQRNKALHNRNQEVLPVYLPEFLLDVAEHVVIVGRVQLAEELVAMGVWLDGHGGVCQENSEECGFTVLLVDLLDNV